MHYLRQNGKLSPATVDLAAAFFIQKDHESNVYWTEMVGDQISSLTSQTHLMKEEIINLRQLIDSFTATIKTQSQMLDLLIDKRVKQNITPYGD